MKNSLISRLRWTKFGTPPQRAAEAFALAPHPRPDTSTGLALELYGIPLTPEAERITVRNEVRFLLKVAAEIEHGLLVQYLYSAYSINSMSQLGPTWHTTIKNIAVQEMDHLINVQNMLLAVKNETGQPPTNEFVTYFDRESFPVPPDHVGYYPYAFRLEPFTGDSLSKYVSAESPLPETIGDPSLRAELEKIIARAKQVTGMRTFGHVGTLYAYLYWLFLPSDTAEGPWPNFPADWFRRCVPGRHLTDNDFADPTQLDLFEADPREFRANDGNASNYPHNDMNNTHRWVFRVKSSADALRAINQIAYQGEGTEVEMDLDSHFLEFLGVYRDVALLTPPASDKVHFNVPTNPNLRYDPETVEGRIVNHGTRLWARLCNTRYLMLLQELPLSLTLPRDMGPQMATREALINDAISTEMQIGIRYLATKLVTLQRADNPQQFAGPPFELPDSHLPDTPAEQWKELGGLIAVSAALIKRIRALTGPAQPTMMDDTMLQKLEKSDQTLLGLFPLAFQPPHMQGDSTVPAPKLNSFADVQTFFNNFITTNGTDLSGSPHGAFWNGTYDAFVNGDVPGVSGVKILVKGNANQSNLILILQGPITVGGRTIEQMPADGSPYMSADLIASLADWINRGCPQ
jgi:Ferritin-like